MLEKGWKPDYWLFQCFPDRDWAIWGPLLLASFCAGCAALFVLKTVISMKAKEKEKEKVE